MPDNPHSIFDSCWHRYVDARERIAASTGTALEAAYEVEAEAVARLCSAPAHSAVDMLHKLEAIADSLDGVVGWFDRREHLLVQSLAADLKRLELRE